MANFEEESTMVCDLAKFLGIGISNPTNPNRASLETGMDVLTLLAGRKIGVQVTVYHADEAQVSGRKGSFLRREEEKKARQALRQDGVKAYGTWAPANYIPQCGIGLERKFRLLISILTTTLTNIGFLWRCKTGGEPLALHL
jgi:hypothetical protein